MKKHSKNKIIIVVSVVVLAGLVIYSLCVGNYRITPIDLFEYIKNKFYGYDYNKSIENVFVNIRLVRIVTAIIVGASLSIAGLVYQNVFSNNMVSPDLLGVSSAAACGAAIAIILRFSSKGTFFSSFVFSVVAIVLTNLLSKILNRKDNLLLAGIIVAGFARSGLGLLKYIADPENGQLESIVYWEMGSLSKVTWNDFFSIAPIMLCVIIVLFLLRYRISCLILRENANLLGINVKVERAVAIALSSLLVSFSTAICGVISWVALIVPIAASDMTKSGSLSDNYIITGLLGSIFLLLSDDIARAATTSEIPLSIMTGALGLLIFCVAICIGKEKK